jgi:SAM-dependent methyltransferase
LNIKVTRGYGLLEGFLARQRVKLALSQIPPSYKKGSILDIGCGRYPLFLLKSGFSKRFGLDKVFKEGWDSEKKEITLINCDVSKEQGLPFKSDYFEVVTMLAVFEHIEPERLVPVLSEINRVLKPGGLYIMTTPAVWTDRLLGLMARLRLVSRAEIEDHKDAYSLSRISSILIEAGFSEKNIQTGHFQIFLNSWARAEKITTAP